MSNWIEFSVLMGLLIAAASATWMALNAGEGHTPAYDDEDGFWAGADRTSCGGCGGCSGCGGCGA